MSDVSFEMGDDDKSGILKECFDLLRGLACQNTELKLK